MQILWLRRIQYKAERLNVCVGADECKAGVALAAAAQRIHLWLSCRLIFQSDSCQYVKNLKSIVVSVNQFVLLLLLFCHSHVVAPAQSLTYRFTMLISFLNTVINMIQ